MFIVLFGHARCVSMLIMAFGININKLICAQWLQKYYFISGSIPVSSPKENGISVTQLTMDLDAKTLQVKENEQEIEKLVSEVQSGPVITVIWVHNPSTML